MPHSPRSSSNNTRDTHTCTVLSWFRYMAANSPKCPFSSKMSVSEGVVALDSDGISVSPGVVFVLPGAVSTVCGTSLTSSKENSAPSVQEMLSVSSADVGSASLFEEVRLLSEPIVLSESLSPASRLRLSSAPVVPVPVDRTSSFSVAGSVLCCTWCSLPTVSVAVSILNDAPTEDVDPPLLPSASSSSTGCCVSLLSEDPSTSATSVDFVDGSSRGCTSESRCIELLSSCGVVC
ncbi:hypothetical protein ECC02_008915 [Trypanosoma cruzi]|uniref:Uncharacterized protein n=1 Tax=Trypanosoma cruzi TaxID=5693 RepID=A0A7J6XUE5_TRYCR|nr:hypothetical protein ECC02_008915 [Trypanosoma cruzi]